MTVCRDGKGGRRAMAGTDIYGVAMAGNAAIHLRARSLSRDRRSQGTPCPTCAGTRWSSEQSAAADAVFYIQKGKIKIVVASKEGKEAVVGVMGPGDFFGEGCLIGQPLRLATAKAMIESQVVRVEQGRDVPGPSRRAELRRAVHDASSDAQQPGRGRPGRPALQLERKAAGAHASSAGEYRQGRRPAADHHADQPGNAGRNHRHDALARESSS